ncbi:hypothetical protein POTOM_054294 [Populus tomentosa]|uniref:Uncharacterized protein n=1 Tax=Populus tomentosa TaxID=118781 RepID=A0A8X7Y4H0_POPTO|nr:hypothetical protein POTOM_054294 [Populus tomentosa]
MECKKVGLLLMVALLVVATVPRSTVATRQVPLLNIMFADEMNEQCHHDGQRCDGNAHCCENFVCEQKHNVCVPEKKGEEDGWSEGTKIGSALNGASVSALLGLAASSLGIISFESPAYSILLEFLFPLTIPLLLFRADLRRVFTSTGIFLLAFLIGTVGKIVRTLLACMMVPILDSVAIATAFPTQFNLLAPSGEALAMILTQVAIHLVAILGLGKLFRFDQKPLLIASNANIGGPTTASGMANAKGLLCILIVLAHYHSPLYPSPRGVAVINHNNEHH